MDDPRRTAPYDRSRAYEKYRSLQAHSLIRRLLGVFGQRREKSLLSFDQVHEIIRDSAEIDRGTQLIPIDSIVGSVGRYRDFTRAFLPLPGADEERWEQLDVAVNELRALPPIDAYKIGDVYFVRDGNHRVSVARANGAVHIEANVTEIQPRVPLTPEMDVDDVIIKAEYARFLERTGLDGTRPGHEIALTEPGRYRILLEHIEVHRYYMGLERHRRVPRPEAAAHWYDTVYSPVIEAIRTSGVLHEFPDRTEADLYLWVAYHREILRKRYGDMPPDEAVAARLARQFSERPVAGWTRRIRRAIRAGIEAARESPEPPGDSR